MTRTTELRFTKEEVELILRRSDVLQPEDKVISIKATVTCDDDLMHLAVEITELASLEEKLS